ncbi:MAG TPA: glucoamylase family protein [Bryobacteraceae bacterium]|nr:glucoamylase family protein [Bryobacteraceae bacterium]
MSAPAAATVAVDASGQRLLPWNGPHAARQFLVHCGRLIQEQIRRPGQDWESAGRVLQQGRPVFELQLRYLEQPLSPAGVKRLPREGNSKEPRIYRIAARHVAQTAGALDADTLLDLAATLRNNSALLLREWWAYDAMLRLALLQRLCGHLQDAAAVSACIHSLRLLDRVSWRDFVESICPIEKVLRRDPAGVYANMDFATREWYRREVEKLARRSGRSELEVAEQAVACAREALAPSGPGGIAAHVGYYLIGAGAQPFSKFLGCRSSLSSLARRVAQRWPGALYAACVLLMGLLMMAGFVRLAGAFPLWMWLLLLLPASHAALEIANSLVSHFLPPRPLPHMDFQDGIPDSCRTLVVVPCLLPSPARVRKLARDLEIRYLANRDENLMFGLLTDFPDADREHTEADSVLDICVEEIDRLNARYPAGARPPFYLFHRKRQWNPGESKWMGYERKRGKLNDLNKLLLEGADRFDVVRGERLRLRSVRYVITLDADTELPRDTAAKLIGCIAHPLNRPVLDAVTRTVTSGYAMIQPRVPVSLDSAGRSLFSRIFSGLAGFDPYSASTSDLYQDLFGRASFIGKGIYDVAAFDGAVGNRFPENSILSHDLIEGEHVRTALLSSVDLLEDCPATYQAFCRRKHRWVRGDWQLLPWLFANAPGPGGTAAGNPLSLLSRWKIFDNLRRSLVEIALLVLLVAGWILLNHPLRWTVAVFALLLAPAYAIVLLSLTRPPHQRRLWPAFARDLAVRIWHKHRDAFLIVAFLAHQSCLMADAIVRTCVRRFVTHRKLLEWQTMEQSEALGGINTGMVAVYFYLSAGCVLLFLLSSEYLSLTIGVVCALWIIAPLIAAWLSEPVPEPAKLSERDRAFLRDTGLRTWRFFADLSDAPHHWLVPDNIQQDPPLTAHRISPTNLGMSLTAQLAAHDFGYQTLEELTAALERTFGSMTQLQRHKGHLFNWYDTASLEPVRRYVSTVDSGNLAASLCTLRQGLLALPKQPLWGPHTLAGLRDHWFRLRDQLWPEMRSQAVMRTVASLSRLLECEPTSLFFWESVLTEAQELIARVQDALDRVPATPERPNEDALWEELRYWERLVAERAGAVLRELYALAPWLAPPLEPELRLNVLDPSLSALMAELSAPPVLAGLPQQYERIQARLTERLAGADPLYPALHEALRKLQERLPAACASALNLIRRLEKLSDEAGRYFDEMEFAFLYEKNRGLLRIGYNADTGRADEACYDLLASEARTAVFLAVAKGDVPRETWLQLGRKVTAYRKHRALLSWSGTMFEYLMPLLHLRSHSNSLLDRSLHAALRIQQAYARECGVPWGISEAAYGSRDHRMQYQYQAFGVPVLSACPDRPKNLVVAPYATLLALMLEPVEAVANLRSLENFGCVGRYGFYESLDFLDRQGPPETIRCFMAHHQGMGLLAIVNALLNGRMQQRFHQDPLVRATEFLLEERMPALVEIIPPQEQPAAA